MAGAAMDPVALGLGTSGVGAGGGTPGGGWGPACGPQQEPLRHRPHPLRFAAVTMRIREPKTTALAFASGKMVCTGANGEENSKLAARKYARIIQKIGYAARFKDFKIQNMVASCDVKFPIRLEGLAYSHGAFSNASLHVLPNVQPVGFR